MPRSCAELSCQYGGHCVEYYGVAQCNCDQLPCLRADYPHAFTVCGSDFETYQSECELKIEACKQQTNIERQYNGPCVGGSPRMGPTTPASNVGRPRNSYKTTRHVESPPPDPARVVTPIQIHPTEPQPDKTPLVEGM